VGLLSVAGNVVARRKGVKHRKIRPLRPGERPHAGEAAALACGPALIDRGASDPQVASMNLAGGPEAERQLGRLIAENRAEIEQRWLERVRSEIDRDSTIEPTQLRDGMPDYLRRIAAMLEQSAVPSDTDAREIWLDVAREHGVTRVRIGFDIGQLVREFVLLRHVIREVISERGGPLHTLGAVLADILDAAIGEAVRAYVEARDHQARRKQAEHIGFLTHELRNPLATATLTASQLRRELGGAQHSRTLERLERSHQRLSELIERVLRAEKIEAGHFRTHPVDVSLGIVLDAVFDTPQAVAAAKGLEFRVSYDTNIALHVDPLLTRSAIQNLVENAIKYTEHGWVEVSAEERTDDIVIHFRDSCAGIPPDDLHRIFEPFERGAAHRQGQQEGTGLGLAIARRAIEAQGGVVGAESPEPMGCHFWIVLPKRVEGRVVEP
jgi:signal transduction histidine kinase